MRHLVKVWQYTSFSLKQIVKSPDSRMASTSFNYFDSHGLLQPGSFSLQVGAPNQSSLQKIASYLKRSTTQFESIEGYEQSLQYGCDVGGNLVRDEVAKFLSRGYKLPVDKNDIFITCGATAALQHILTHFFTNDHVMFVEDPSYLLVPDFLKNGFFMKGDAVPLEDDGINLEVLEAKLKLLPDKPVTERHPFKAAVYVIPVYQNPTGICYSSEKCQKLVELARKYDLLVIADDIYNLLTYKTLPGKEDTFESSPARLFTYDNKSDVGYKGNVISNGTFSKIAAPGLRCGWFEAPQRVINHINSLSYISISGGGMSYYLSHIFSGLLKSKDLDSHIYDLQLKHKKRMEVVISCVENRLGKYGVTISQPDGGYFLWVKLPKHVTGGQVLEYSKVHEKVTFVPGIRTSLVGNFANYIRLSIAYYEADELAEGAERFCRAVECVIKTSSNL